MNLLICLFFAVEEGFESILLRAEEPFLKSKSLVSNGRWVGESGLALLLDGLIAVGSVWAVETGQVVYGLDFSLGGVGGTCVVGGLGCMCRLVGPVERFEIFVDFEKSTSKAICFFLLS